ncbi:sensor histidine kinase [Kribbella qitaiheensis]|uniref:Oxygen sensor histidine kinase NreB n=1 Tax=Kribbella qitaiheensis TaxID=1544730 RepID=A0A7G6WZZ9_9ACTN|nr:sensor histidine kinase [Kribbella qitaiheensis]QNE19564.1 sensor histidine kinase [Kribbella qitaiheensis]
MTISEQTALSTGARRATGVDLALALTGLVVSLARTWHPSAGWSYGDLPLVILVALAPALIALRRVAPIPVAVVMMGAALVALILGEFDAVLIGGCALALWSVAALGTWPSVAAAVGVVAGLPLFASWGWMVVVPSAFNRTAQSGLVEYQGQMVPGFSHGIAPEDVSRFTNQQWPWWLSVALAAVWLTAFLVRRYRKQAPVIGRHGTPGDWLESLRQFAARRENVLWLDAMLAIAMTALQLLDIRRGQAMGNWWVAPDWLVYTIAAMPLSLVLRRYLPIVPCVLLAAVSIPAFWAADDITFLLVALAIALFSLASHGRRLLAVPVAVVLLTAVPVLSRQAIEHWKIQLWFFPVLTKNVDLDIDYGHPLDYGYEYFRVAERVWPISLSLVLALATVFGLLARVYRRTREGAVREAELERRALEQDAAQVVLTERSHIARDLHDVVAHAVNLMVIQAETGPDLLERGDQDVLAGFQRIGDAGRRALSELDRMLSALRDSEGLADPALTPQPGLAELPQLVQDVSHELKVDLDLHGNTSGLPEGHQLTAYRLVQEALTNVVRHAEAAKVTVTLDVRADELMVEVADDGHGFDPEVAREGGRHGLAGMRERVRIHDGRLTIDSAPGRGTTVSAWIPVPEQETAMEKRTE